MRLAALGFALLTLAACQWDPPSQGARDSSVPPLTVEGYGDMRIGMTLAEARTASGQALDAEALEPDAPGACSEQQYTTTDGDMLWLMFEGDKLVRITATNEGGARTRTAQNVGVGSTDAEVRTAYQNLVEEGSHYNAAPAHNLIAWTVPEQSGILFEVNEQGVVTAVHAGGPQIQYMEGCA
ncbi:hypothetical protein [Terricaulis sp.]|uniref:hypothetical protein n=1 Tax=Terricaulis sp. TaxID=2768686 RepID=UPI0037846720